MPSQYAGFFGPAVVTNIAGDAQANTDVTVRNPDTTLASLWTDKDRSTAVANPVTTNARGQFDFFGEPGPRKITANGVSRDIVIQPHPDEGEFDDTAHTTDATGAHSASAVSVVPAGSIASTDAQSALVELDTAIGDEAVDRTMADTAEATARDAAIEAHRVDTTAVHGIADTAVLETTTGAQAKVDAAVAALLDSAPGALDTLNELAAAFGDDPNFAATVTNALATKLNLSLYDANTLLAADVDDTPTARTIGEDRVVGRVTGGSIGALTSTQVRAILAILEDADAGTASLRTLGTGAAQALPGNHPSTTDQRVPTDGSVSTVKIGNGEVTPAKLSFDPATQSDLDAETAARVAAVPLTGVGSPEGVVAASAGRLYEDTENGVLYVKNSGVGTTGWLRVVTRGAAVGVIWPTKADSYYGSPITGTGINNALGNGTLRVTPLWVPRLVTVDRIRAEVTTIGDVGSLVRLGVYRDDGTGYPGDLLLDAGTIAGDSTGTKEITVNQAVTPGLWWLGSCIQASVTLQPTMRAIVGLAPNVIHAGGTLSTVPMGYLHTGVAAALPATFVTTPNLAGAAARILVRVN